MALVAGLVSFATGIAQLLFAGAVPKWSVAAAYAAIAVFMVVGVVRGVRATTAVTGTTR